VQRWRRERDAIRLSVPELGFDERRSTFTRAFDDSGLDAALALVGALGFDDARSPRVAGTLDAIRSELGASGPLLYRYQPGDDGLEGGEGAFLPCSFWLAQGLAHAGRVEDAAQVLEQLTSFASPLGLFAEEADPSTGDLLGNHPQALTHSSFVLAALALRDATVAATA
jgi:GH15 family glucan-1,4-alpha-glucosidase